MKPRNCPAFVANEFRTASRAQTLTPSFYVFRFATQMAMLTGVALTVAHVAGVL